MGTPVTAALINLSIPSIGEIWPGQGGRFGALVGGKNGKPFFALIVPTDERAHFENVALGTYRIDVSGATSKKNGMANTKALAEAGSELCQKIRALEIEGHTDFFLMSSSDAQALSANVPELFKTDRYYSTSTQCSSYDAFVQDFEDGGHYVHLKVNERRACAVRLIQLTHSAI